MSAPTESAKLSGRGPGPDAKPPGNDKIGLFSSPIPVKGPPQLTHNMGLV